MMNYFFLDGFMITELELKESGNGTKYVKFPLSVSRKSGDEYISKIFNCVAFGATAEYICNYANKGDRINCIGSLDTSSYTINEKVEDKNGVKVKERIINQVELIVKECSLTKKKEEKKHLTEEEPVTNHEQVNDEKEQSNIEQEKNLTVEEWYRQNCINKSSEKDLYIPEE